MPYLRSARRAAAATVLYIAAASVGLLTEELPIAIGLLAAAGCLHFLLGMRRYRREHLPRPVLLGILRDQIEEFHRNVDGCELEPCWAIWLPVGDSQLVVCVADSRAEVRIASHATQEPDMSSAIWAAYHTKEACFETFSPRAVPAQSAGTVQTVDTRDWAWRMAYPVFDLADTRKVVGVVAVQGVGDVSEPADLASFNIPELCERACHMARRIVSVLTTYG